MLKNKILVKANKDNNRKKINKISVNTKPKIRYML